MKKTALLLKSLLLTTTLLAGSTVFADEIVVPVGQQGADKTSLDRPKTGMRADKVEEKFGAPIKKSEAVGKPPISNWEYPEYRVYFEADRVIHTVLKPMPTEAADVVPAAAAPAPVAPAVVPEAAPPQAVPETTAAETAAPVAPPTTPTTTETPETSNDADENTEKEGDAPK